MMEKESKISANDKYSLPGMVYQKLHEDILSGIYKKDDMRKEGSIGEKLGVSRTPVREALRQLELEGLVKIVPNKGAYVIGISTKDIRDIYEMRASLEGLCARWVTKNADEEGINRLEEIVELAEFHCEKKKYSKVVGLDNEFHELMYILADSKMLYRTLSDFHHYLEVIRKKTLSSDERVSKSVQEHRDIIEAIKAGKEDEAEKFAILHMKNTMDYIDGHNVWGDL